LKWAATLFAAVLAAPVFAHSASTAYLEVGFPERATEHAAQPAAGHAAAAPLIWRVALRDLDARLDLDANADGQLTWGEVEDRTGDIVALAAASLTVTGADGRACPLAFARPGFERLDDTGFARLAARADCGGAAAALDYRFLEDLDPSHRVLVTTPSTSGPRLLAPGSTMRLAADGAQTSAREHVAAGFVEMFVDGARHIVGGLDHLLFLVALLLPAVLTRAGGSWVARQHLRPALIQVAWIATAFTVAHSITLGRASFHVLRVPAAVIEPLIAVTVLAAALNNIKPVVTTRLAACAFVFGLIHGFGFAEVLAPLGLPTEELALALLAFNLGVEAGQLVIVAAAFALLASLRRWHGYPRWVLGSGSAALALIAVGWIVERVFDVPLLALAAFGG
jgi:hypothetical protein